MTALVTKHLPLVAGAPDGIKKLRALIQQLAVQGRLIPKTLGWQTLKLADLGKWAVGSGFPTAEQGKKDLPILFCKVSDMNLVGNERFIRNTNHTIDEETARRLRVNVHPAGTVVFPKIGGAISTNKRRILIKPSAIDNNCLGISPPESVSSDYLYLLLTSIDFTAYQAGTSVPALSQGVIGQISVGLPTLIEQQRIVAKVDELMALCDRLEADQADAEAAHAQLVQALLDSLTQATDAADFRASWQRLSEHFHTLFTTEASVDALRKAFLHLAADGRLLANDEDVAVLAIGDVLDGNTLNGCSRKPTEEARGTPILRISAGTGSDDFYVDESDYRWVELTAAELTKFRLEPDDLLACRFNGNLHYVGSFSLYRGLNKGVQVFPDKLIRFRANRELVLPKYLRLVMNAKPAREQIEAFCATTVGNIGISASNLKTVKIRIPSLPEQHRIVAKVDELMALCDQLKAQLAEARQQHAQLATALVEQAVA